MVADATRQLGEYFAGARRGFDLPLGPPHDGLLGRVPAALGRNPLAIVLPCHRLIGAGGALVGFGGGLDGKRVLLDQSPQLQLT